MTDRPLITFFVMAYNQERHVRAAIEGAFAQTYQPLEILLSDDYSTDGTFAIMESMAAAYDGPHRVKLNRNPENLGLVAHVNRVVEMSDGALIVASAGDDISDSRRVEQLAGIWLDSRDAVMLLHSAAMQIDDTGRDVGLREPVAAIIGDPSPLTIARSGHNCIGATAAWNRQLFERFGPLQDLAAIEDGPMFFRAALLDGIRYLDAPLVRYRIGGISQLADRHARPELSYGIRMKGRRWRLANARCFLDDIKKVGDVRDREAVQRTCEASVEVLTHTLALPDRNLAWRLALLPKAALLSIARRRKFYLLNTLKHVFERPYLAVRNYLETILRVVRETPKA